MPLPRSPKFLLLCGVLLVTSAASPRLSQAFTAVNPDSRLDINSIDIAPTSTPIPTLKPRRKPTPKIVRPAKHAPSVTHGDKLLPEKTFFNFSLSSQAVDFGTIDATNPVIRTHTMKLEPGTARGYTLLAYENHPLQITDEKQSFIPDTTCDDGNCTESIASLWQNTLTYGLGFRCDEDEGTNHCMPEFRDQQSYKQFADLGRKEPGATVLSATGEETIESRLTYKVNIPGTQKPGRYANVLVFIAVPGY